jgi:2-polyprenyl-3-methyl-5-hydroxy-6-metoxy-1,4-benzoquinol methylase
MTKEQKSDFYDSMHDRFTTTREQKMVRYGWDREYNKVRLQYIFYDTSKVDIKGKKVLDVGCAKYSYMSDYCKNAEVIGIDISYKTIDFLSKSQRKGAFFVSDTAWLPFKSSVFDLIFAGEILEHVEKPELVLNEWQRILKKNGLLIITTPNRDRISIRQSQGLRLEDFLRAGMAKYIGNPIYGDTHEDIHCSELSFSELNTKLVERGFKVIKAYGIGIYGILLSGIGIVLPQYFPKLATRFHRFFLGLGKNNPNLAGQMYVLAQKEV